MEFVISSTFSTAFSFHENGYMHPVSEIKEGLVIGEYFRGVFGSMEVLSPFF